MTNFTDKKDDTLVELALLGNQQAYEELITRYEHSVKGTAYKVTGNEFSAEDASQDAFVSAWMNLDCLRERDKFGSWVCAIAKNCSRSLVTHYRSVTADISLNLLENVDLAESDDTSPEFLLAAKFSEHEQDERLHEEVEALSEKIRDTIKLHYFHGLSVEQIAKKLSLPEGTVKWRLSEGRKQLRKGYGVMEKTYDEKESLVRRVMRQVEQLKLWRLKNDKTGFEKDYRSVLANVGLLEESKEKQHALADTLMIGYWWLPGEKNKEMLSNIKAAAEKSHNEEVMQSVMAYENENYSGQARLDFMRKSQIPYLEKNGFVKTLGYEWFWLGCTSFDIGQNENGFAALHKVLEVLKPSDVYYATALAAIYVEEKKQKVNELSDNEPIAFGATGEVYRYIGNKLYMWEQPGFSRNSGDVDSGDSSLFWNCSQCDSLIIDSDMKPGESVVSSDKNMTLTCKGKGLTVVTPAGTFKNCIVTALDGDFYSLKHAETTFCPGIGLVRQIVKRYGDEHEWQLSAYTLNGGDGIIPFARGNRWEYSCYDQDGVLYEHENIFEVTSFENGRAVIEGIDFTHISGYDESSWKGNIIRARREYCKTAKDQSEHLVDVEEPLRRAAKLAVTKRQKLHTALATDVMHRIFDTDPDFNPGYTEKGRWNFFDICSVAIDGGKIKLSENNRAYGFEWKDMALCGEEGYKILYNFLYDILNEAAGCLWSDKWIPGTHFETEKNETQYNNSKTHLIFDVLPDESVAVPAGTFQNCRHILFDRQGLAGGWGYRGGKMEYWFAPEVGIVKFSRPVNETVDNSWQLTDYRGRGDGYFPVADGLFRRYEPAKIGNGWHGSVEYTFDEDKTGIVLFRNALGTQDRANYEADMKKAKAEKGSK